MKTRFVTKILSGAVIVTGVAAGVAIGAYAQDQAPAAPSMSDVTVNDPPGPIPNPANIPFTPPDKLVWTGDPNSEQQIKLFGDPNKPGIYGVLVKWNPGHGSRPHFHDHDRYIYVLSGTWWVSSSTHYDPRLTHPLPAGTFATDLANTVHWDGARAGGPPAILEIVGMGPVISFDVDESGVPLPHKHTDSPEEARVRAEAVARVQGNK